MSRLIKVHFSMENSVLSMSFVVEFLSDCVFRRNSDTDSDLIRTGFR